MWGLVLDVSAWAFVRGTSALWNRHRGLLRAPVWKAVVQYREGRERLQKGNDLSSSLGLGAFPKKAIAKLEGIA